MITAIIILYVVIGLFSIIYSVVNCDRTPLETITIAIYWLPLLLVYTTKEAYNLIKQAFYNSNG